MRSERLGSRIRHSLGVVLGRKVVLPSMCVILATIAIAIFAPLIAPHSPSEVHLDRVLRPPDREHLFGTDELGRDQLSRIVYGTRISLTVAVVSVSIAVLCGVPLGLIAGYIGGSVGSLIMRCVDALMCFPPIVIALGLAFGLGGGTLRSTVAIAVPLMPLFIRVAHAQALSIKEFDYVMAARVVGCSNLRVVLFHVFRNTVPLVVVLATVSMALAILYEAALSYLGVGIKQPNAAWGSMLRFGFPYLLSAPWLTAIPGLCIALLVSSFNLVGDAIRDMLDPKLTGEIHSKRIMFSNKETLWNKKS